ncbi:beta strand repeat-containing protein [Mesorhizobium sp. ASY16-5R]|uniref:beta strand repeat-containing protein n=1 Tax=Mesorhizobium sp. ASY16-5R TaxID=3445772 RepID=UPI003FA17D2E
MAIFTGGNANETITPGLVSPTVVSDGAPRPGAGDDVLNGNGGNDTLAGGGGSDQMLGGAGNDRMIWNSGDGTDLMEGGDDTDTAEANGGSAGEVFSITANGTRVRFDLLDPAPSFLDIGTTETLIVNMGGGDDKISMTGNLAALIKITVDGGAGNDTILGGNGADTLFGGEGNDFVDGNQGNDLAFLGDGDDIFQWDPGDGNDTVEGQAGFDALSFNGSNINEIIGISANGGRALFTRNVANIVMVLDDVESIKHNALGGADVVNVNDLSGTDVKQVEINLSGVLGGTAGDGAVDDVSVNGTNGGDSIKVSGGASNVTVSGLATTVKVTTLEAGDIVRINALGGNDTVNAATALHALILNGGIGDDTLRGGSGNDILQGGDDKDTLAGGLGGDQMLGEGGDDRMVWNSSDGTDLMEGGDGIDTAEVNGSDGSEEFAVTANGARVRFDRLNPSPSALDIGTTENLVVDMGGGDDTIAMTGNLAALIKITVDGGAGDDTILGSNGADLLIGGDGNDFVDGNQGSDALLLGEGDDVAQWDPGDGNDTIEGQGGFDALRFNGANINEIIGISANGDRAQFTRNIANIVMDLNDVERIEHHALGGADAVNVNDLTGTGVKEVLVDLAATLGGTAGDAAVDQVNVAGTNGGDAVKVTGGSANMTVSGLSAKVLVTALEITDGVAINVLGGNDTVDASAALHAVVVNGGTGNDTLTGSASADFLAGGDDADTISGGSGNDLMFGENGDDRLVWNSGDGTDLIEGDAGTDTVEVNGGGGSEVFLVSANVDRVRVEGTNPELFALDIGTSEALVLNAGDGDDVVTMTGALGALIAIRVNGGAGDDTISAADGNDVLDGGTGADRLEGGFGDDIYIVDTQGDVVVETAEQGAADRVMVRVSYTLAADNDIELLTTTSASATTAINLTGNALAQEIVGNAGVNVLKDGGGAGDVLRGLGGNDTYLVYSAATTVIETATQGNADRVLVNVDYVLSSTAHIEQLATTSGAGKAAIDLTGNALGQEVIGNAGDNRIDGKGGGDTLHGLGGNDTFVFSTALGVGNVDTIVDFSTADDRFLLSDAIFTALSTGVLAAAAFRVNTTGAAGDSTDRIIYESDTGKLFYDADGTGAGAGIHFSTVGIGLNLTNADFSVA